MATTRRRSLILLDLDETLVCSIAHTTAVHYAHLPPPDYYYADLDGYFRPHAVDFVRFCRRHFDYVAVLTAGTADYAAHIVRELFIENAGYTPDATLDRTACVQAENATGAYVKPLHTLRTHLRHLDIDWDNAVLVDDLVMNACTNRHRNTILVPKFDIVALECHNRRTSVGGEQQLLADTWLVDLRRYIERHLRTETTTWAQSDTTFWFCNL